MHGGRAASAVEGRSSGAVQGHSLTRAHAQVDAADGEVAAPGGRPMSFQEKRRLSQALGSLPGDKLGLVMEIIAAHQPLNLVRCTGACMHACVEARGDALPGTACILFCACVEACTHALPGLARTPARTCGPWPGLQQSLHAQKGLPGQRGPAEAVAHRGGLICAALGEDAAGHSALAHGSCAHPERWGTAGRT